MARNTIPTQAWSVKTVGTIPTHHDPSLMRIVHRYRIDMHRVVHGAEHHPDASLVGEDRRYYSNPSRPVPHAHSAPLPNRHASSRAWRGTPTRPKPGR